jgi:hypothetical protein
LLFFLQLQLFDTLSELFSLHFGLLPGQFMDSIK